MARSLARPKSIGEQRNPSGILSKGGEEGGKGGSGEIATADGGKGEGARETSPSPSPRGGTRRPASHGGSDATCLWPASEVGVATIRLRFGGGHGSRRRIGLQYRKSLANQLAPRYARNSAGTPPLPLSLFGRMLSRSISAYARIGKIEKRRGR